MNKEHVPHGIYKDEPWSTVPENYLFYMGNKNGNFAVMCREEVIRRRALRGENDPWTGNPVKSSEGII